MIVNTYNGIDTVYVEVNGINGNFDVFMNGTKTIHENPKEWFTIYSFHIDSEDDKFFKFCYEDSKTKESYKEWLPGFLNENPNFEIFSDFTSQYIMWRWNYEN